MLNKCEMQNRIQKDILVKALELEKMQKMVGKIYVKETSAYNKEGL
jgi:hypothetical protein